MGIHMVSVFVVIAVLVLGVLVRAVLWWARSLPARRWRCRRSTRRVQAQLRRQDGSGELW